MYFQKLIFALFLLIFYNFQAQNRAFENTPKKFYTATRIQEAPKIDGILEDNVWKNKPVASNFVMVEPGDGTQIPETHKTNIKLLYTDEAIYIAAYLHENEPEKIVKRFTQRDNIEVNDFFLIDINTYNDGENQTRFIVTSAGAIADGKSIGNSEDYSYNVVWDAAVSQDEKGWYAEIKIPYAALRFPDKEEQLWGIQFARQITHLNETYSWNYIDKSVGKISQHAGLLKGLKNIDPPVRLSLYPYASVSTDYFKKTSETRFSAGMDLKYGINDAFTLDATLIPDFGQAAFDEVELNLGPFEQTFGENRAFFTEGTELFTKGDLFYSRRVGSTPTGFNEAQKDVLENEEIIENPQKTDLLNALKISGRTENSLGIGFFNAITRETHAKYRDTITGEIREKVTEPLSNYNILVLDQQFNKNSSISLINTNVTREDNFRDGNVTGFLFDLYNKSNSFNISGQAKMSNVNKKPESLTGFASTLSFNRTKGNFRYGVTHDFANETYDINDLGVNFTNNYSNFFWMTSYQIFEPTGGFNTFNLQVYGNHQRRYKPDVPVRTGVGTSLFAITSNRFAFGGFTDINSRYKDFFEPRKDGRFVEYNSDILGEVWVSSDYREKFAYDVRVGYKSLFGTNEERVKLKLKPRFRFNNKFNMIYSFNYTNHINRNSFVSIEDEDIIFGNRDMESIENSLQAYYNFNTKQALSLSFRNFWSTASFSDNGFKSLNEDGSLISTTYDNSGDNDPNVNFNIWNLDLSYRWQFAPGSEAILLYRNSIFNQDTLSALSYSESLDYLFARPARHNLSLRIVYYIDYNNVMNIFKT
ncbi:DUF5916 domain-containing protein [Salegentibacter chungangensis]|uniref:DUF5916 domain-containing protein n=1 Tax=Salegentibacter chungangensis TaxID=1335724 RepID=A0ABW3NRL0_9FLAO